MSDDEVQEVNPAAHKQLLKAIGSLGKSQHISKTTRNEPHITQSEFTLVKSNNRSSSSSAHSAKLYANASGRNSVNVNVNDIVQVLKKTQKHLVAGKQLRNVRNSKKILEKPLEKPVAERLKRTIGYEKVKKNLARWDAVVAKNRTAETQIFPLKGETIYIDTSAQAKPLQMSVKSDLMRDMEATDAKLKKLKKEYSGDFTDEVELAKREEMILQQKLTRDELIARRRELAYIKMRESQKSAKARQQNKIKSKKYHKLMKRQKMLQQITEFEILQKTNPEAALEKLNELEKHRAQERASLRHKNTGSWAKNLQVRAKYDKDVRKDLAEQLQISRELTQKKNVDESDNDDDNDDDDDDDGGDGNKANGTAEMEVSDPFNPWFVAGKKGARDAKIVENGEGENWRKYWLERNENEKLLAEYKNLLKAEEKSEELEDELEDTKTNDLIADESKTNIEKIATEKPTNKKEKTKRKLKIEQKTKTPTKKPKMENGWIVEEIDPKLESKKFKDVNIDDIFDAKEDAERARLTRKMEKLKKTAERLSKKNTKSKDRKQNANKTEKDELKQLNDLSFKNQINNPIIDEALNEDELNDGETAKQKRIEKAATDVNLVTESTAIENGNKKPTTTTTTGTNEVTSIDPNAIAVVKLKQNIKSFNIVSEDLDDADIDDGDEQENAQFEQQQLTITEAFEDDDIVADFTRDKEEDTKLKDIEIQLSMPGWGSWTGAGISAEQEAKNNRNKRLILKLPEKEKRRDENKGGVYINEEAVNKQMRAHLVTDLPFPFTSVQDYEASIRAPIGRNYVPETAMRMLTRPSVITMKGQVIEPMDESELVKPDRRLRHIIDRRIARATTSR